ncbi:MAG: hypothetical protein P8X63_03480, partial [Desulfuromonadaceae bacterium]
IFFKQRIDYHSSPKMSIMILPSSVHFRENTLFAKPCRQPLPSRPPCRARSLSASLLQSCRQGNARQLNLPAKTAATFVQTLSENTPRGLDKGPAL